MTTYTVKTESTVFEGYKDDCIKYIVGFLGLIPCHDFDPTDILDADGKYSSYYGVVNVEEFQ